MQGASDCFSTQEEARGSLVDRVQKESARIVLPKGFESAQLLHGRNRFGSQVSPLEAEVAKLLVRTLILQVDPPQIRPEGPLFGEGLGLDSIDALELSLAISECYEYQIRSDDPETVATFA